MNDKIIVNNLNDMNTLEQKYINLLLKRCINFKNSNSLLISYQSENIDFINKLVKSARQYGIKKIYQLMK